MSEPIRYDIVNRRIVELERLVHQLLTQTTLGNSSITRGRLRVASNEGLLVQGSQKVEGWLVVTGTERVTGLLEVQGRLVASGAIEFTGPTSIAGATTITGDTDIAGDVSLKGTMSVDGGEIQVKGGDSPATLRDGAMSFETGGKVEADAASGGVRLAAGSGNKVYVGEGIVAVQLAGGGVMTITPTGTTISDPNGVMFNASFAISSLPPAPADATPNIWRNPATGTFHQIV